MPLLHTILACVLNIVFPLQCVSCGKNGSDFCPLCIAQSPSALRESAEWIFPIFDYRYPPVKKALHLFKYKNRKRLARVFASAMHDRILEELSDMSLLENFRKPILIPIPLSRERYHERGYNQAELIGKELVKLDKNNNFKLENNILIKPKETKHQAHIENRAERLKNIVGSFSVRNAEEIKNRNVILIDDITTTGATLSEAKKTLKRAGARKVIALAVAH